MKHLIAVALILSLGVVAGCGASNEASVVVDKDEAAQYNTPPGVMEAAVAGQTQSGKKNRGK
ncbi:MAG: hypothetical protein AAFV88_18430 [Planctomycetota bacterium]